jgi:hypothetical protein
MEFGIFTMVCIQGGCWFTQCTRLYKNEMKKVESGNEELKEASH